MLKHPPAPARRARHYPVNGHPQWVDMPVRAAPLSEQILKQVLFGDQLRTAVTPDDRMDKGALRGPVRDRMPVDREYIAVVLAAPPQGHRVIVGRVREARYR